MRRRLSVAVAALLLWLAVPARAQFNVGTVTYGPMGAPQSTSPPSSSQWSYSKMNIALSGILQEHAEAMGLSNCQRRSNTAPLAPR